MADMAPLLPAVLVVELARVRIVVHHRRRRIHRVITWLGLGSGLGSGLGLVLVSA